MNYTVFLRSKAANKNGVAPVCIRLVVERKAKLFTLPVKVLPIFWDEKKGKVKKTDPYSDFKNTIISQWIVKVETAIHTAVINDDRPSVLESTQKTPTEAENSFEAFAKELIQERIGTFSKDTIRSQKSNLNKILCFKRNLSFKTVNTLDFIKAYEKHLRQKIGNNNNTLWKSLTYLKSVLNEAKRKKLIKSNAFQDYKLRKVDGNREFLTIKETEILANLLKGQSLTESEKNVLTYFLFACYTGLRYADLKRLTYQHITIHDAMQNGKLESRYFVEIVAQKTAQSSGAKVSNPLPLKAVALIDMSKPKEAKIFRVISTQKTGKILKEIMKKAGIHKNISTHCARHTFATTLITKGANIAVISRLLGHTNVKTTMIYTKIVDEAKIQAIDLLD